jgi:hypothetical protein
MPSGSLSLEARATYTPAAKTLTLTKGTGVASMKVNGNTYTSPVDVIPGTSVTVEMTLSSGYSTDGWYNGSTKVSAGTSASYTFTMPASNLALTAKATLNKYALTLTKGEGVYAMTVDGTLYTSPVEINFGASVEVEMALSPGYAVDGWYDGSSRKVQTLSYTFTMQADAKTLEARATAITPSTATVDMTVTNNAPVVIKDTKVSVTIGSTTVSNDDDIDPDGGTWNMQFSNVPTGSILTFSVDARNISAGITKMQISISGNTWNANPHSGIFSNNVTFSLSQQYDATLTFST